MVARLLASAEGQSDEVEDVDVQGIEKVEESLPALTPVTIVAVDKDQGEDHHPLEGVGEGIAPRTGQHLGKGEEGEGQEYVEESDLFPLSAQAMEDPHQHHAQKGPLGKKAEHKDGGEQW